MRPFELAVAAVLALLGLRSLARWARRRYESTSVADQLVYLLHVGARVGMWFALAAFFVAYGTVEEPQTLRPYLFVLLVFPSVQLLSGLYLSRSPAASRDAGAADPED